MVAKALVPSGLVRGRTDMGLCSTTNLLRPFEGTPSLISMWCPPSSLGHGPPSISCYLVSAPLRSKR
ncbi:unnamed protein product, partial [Musa textilis]